MLCLKLRNIHMMYVGMGLAHLWDSEWERIAAGTDLYALLRDPRGFDCLDEEVRESVLGFERDDTAYRECEDLVRACAQCALDRIRREQIEPQKAPKHFISMCAASTPSTKWALP